jgi:hypothetical protein
VKVTVLQCVIVNKLKYRLEHKKESFCNEKEDKVIPTIIVQMAAGKEKKMFLQTHLNNFYFHYIDTF